MKALATMPSREELLAKLMGTMQAPIGQFVRTLNEVPAVSFARWQQCAMRRQQGRRLTDGHTRPQATGTDDR